MQKKYLLFILTFFLSQQDLALAQHLEESLKGTVTSETPGKAFVVVLGTIQDAGSPHIGCTKSCCDSVVEQRMVVSLGIVDPVNKRTWIIEATPDLPAQMKLLRTKALFKKSDIPDGIFITHAHIGHYTGLMYLGKEALGADNVPVYAMPKMSSFLESNGPWSQLVDLKNINLIELVENKKVVLSSDVSITPFLVPHRDEFSETVGYRIDGPEKSLLFIPDIDKWSKWETDIKEEIQKVDYALLDATFYSGSELSNRDMSEIPHPFVVESMEKFNDLSSKDRSKIYFIHLNHTNPLLDSASGPYRLVRKAGYNVASLSQILKL